MIITIDGPVASGKTSVARLLAVHFNYFHLSSGLLYRAFAFFLQKEGCGFLSEDAVVECIEACILCYANSEDKKSAVSVNNVLVEQHILDSDAISDIASRISAFEKVRDSVLEKQRAIVFGKNAVVDGRDCGTVVFPHAELKIFLTASAEERAKRLCGRQQVDDIALCLERVKMRDLRDAGRIHSPMRPASDAIIIDNSNDTIDQTLFFIEEAIRKVIS